MSTTHRARAYAKVNLALAVGPPVTGHGPKAGWHRIASWMHAIDLSDDIEAEQIAGDVPPADRFDLRWADDAPLNAGEPLGWPIEKDLVFKAVQALEQAVGRALPTKINLRKRIPGGGGLGGGSANAAAALTLTAKAHALSLTDRELADIAATVGSDVAYFLDAESGADSPPRPAIVEGFGDRITRLERCEAVLLLILPPFGCATGAVYKDYDEHMRRDKRGFDRKGIEEASATGAPEADLCMNDLTHAAIRVEPRLAGIIERAEAVAGADRVRMSGSGSTLFVLVSASEAGTIEQELARVLHGDGATIIRTRLV
ncbi:MAG: hypothetical protein EA423_06895 [Phycisphaerales bacterium]|nr:MAG: hypothetical protein EA423_06895 [Phycisphaerales bacterium]